jgi:putative transposase
MSVVRMCRLAQLSRASFYRHGEGVARDQEETELRDAIQREYVSRRPNGYRPITRALKREGWIVNGKRVRRLMREDNLLGLGRRKFVVTTDSDHDFLIYPNLAQNLVLSDINQLWVADLTYVRLLGEFVYLAVVLDAWSRRVLGWSVERHMRTSLAVAALEQAIVLRQPRPGLVHHSDRGSQYASNEYVERLEQLGARMSMSRAGSPWENGKCERFMRTLKQEQLDGRPYRNLEELRLNLEGFLETVYNRQRMHSALGYRSPEEFEQQRPAVLETAREWRPAVVSFRRHREIYSDASGD